MLRVALLVCLTSTASAQCPESSRMDFTNGRVILSHQHPEVIGASADHVGYCSDSESPAGTAIELKGHAQVDYLGFSVSGPELRYDQSTMLTIGTEIQLLLNATAPGPDTTSGFACASDNTLTQHMSNGLRISRGRRTVKNPYSYEGVAIYCSSGLVVIRPPVQQ